MNVPSAPKRAVFYVRNEPYSGSPSDEEFEKVTETVDAAIPGVAWAESSYEEDAGTRYLDQLLLEAQKEPYGILFVVYRLEHLGKADRILPALQSIHQSPAYFFSYKEPRFRWTSPTYFSQFGSTIDALTEFREAQTVARSQRAALGLKIAKHLGRRVGRNARPPCLNCGHRHKSSETLPDGTQKRYNPPLPKCPVAGCQCGTYRPATV